jgi:HEAT repeat protein
LDHLIANNNIFLHMKRTFALIFFFGVVLAGLAPNICRADASEETHLIQVLQSATASPADKSDACTRLKQIGTSSAIKPLAVLLTNEQLSICARYALETIPDAAAGRALLKALPNTSGSIQAGIINSLGARGEKDAVKPLEKLLSSSDTNVAMASAEALGRIGGSKALQSLQRAAEHSDAPVHRTEIDGILMCANRLMDAGKSKDALEVFEKLYNSEKSDTTRLAAFRGILMASGPRGISRMADAIASGDGPTQSAALQVAALSPGADVTRALSEVLPKATVPVQLAVLQCVAQRNDPGAMSAVAKLVDNADAGVAVAALTALGTLGDDSVVGLLAEQAASGVGPKRNAARESLLLLNRGPVSAKMLAALKSLPPPAKAEVIRALAGREDRSTVPALMDVAETGSEVERTAAFQALGQLAGSAEIPRLMEIIKEAHTDDARSGAADALNSIFQRAQPNATFDLTAFVSAVRSGSPDIRLALLPICSAVAQPPVRDALRAAASDADPNIRDAGIHALCDTKDPALLPDLIKLAQDTNQPTVRVLAIRGCVRLTTQEESVQLPDASKLETLSALLQTPLNTQEKQMVLSGLGAVADLKALDIAQGMLDDSSVHAEAENAIIQIASRISKPHPNKARAALRKIVQETANPDTKTSAQAALNRIK